MIFIRFIIVISMFLFQSIAAKSSEWEVSLLDKAKTPAPKENGATATYVNPKGGDSSYLVDAAINLKKGDFYTSNSNVNAFSVEVHRNTLTDKEVDTQELSYTHTRLFLNENKNKNRYSYHNVPLKVGYKIDNENDTESIIGSISYFPKTWSKKDKKSWLTLARDIYLVEKSDFEAPLPIRINWQPNFGVSYEERVKSENNINGSVARFNAGINITINLQSDRWFKNGKKDRNDWTSVETLTFSLTHQYWNDISKDEGVFGKDDSHELTTAKISYPLDLEGDVRVSYSFLKGENPLKDKPKQEYSTVAFEIKI